MKSIHKGFYQTTFGICLLEHDILYQVGKLPCFFLDHLLILSFDHDSYQRFGSGRTDQDTALSGGNIFAGLMDVVRVASLGQISHALYEVGGKYRRNM